MKTKQFGSTGLTVSELGLGCARIGGIFKNDPAQFVELLATARDRGITFFDTADMYSQGESETLVGKAFHRRRDQVIIASKVGYCLPARRRWIARVKPLVRPLIRLLRINRDKLPAGVRGQVAQDFSPTYIRTALHASLRRLRTNYLDILQLHSPPAEIVKRGEWLQVLEDLKRAGDIRFYGISCDTVEAADAALAYPNVSSIQVPISLLHTPFVAEIVPRAQRQGVAVIARECLANGLLVKRAEEIDLTTHGLSADEIARKQEALASVRRAANERGIALSRYALDYAGGLPGVSVALVGVSRREQLEKTLQDAGV